jgi:hypothetical protein
MALVIEFLPARTMPPLRPLGAFRSEAMQDLLAVVTTPLTESHEMLSTTSFSHMMSVSAEK